MKSRKNLTRLTSEMAGFSGWRLCLTRRGTTFVRYFPDARFGSDVKSLAAAEKALAELKVMLDAARTVSGRLSATTVVKAQKLLTDAVPE